MTSDRIAFLNYYHIITFILSSGVKCRHFSIYVAGCSWQCFIQVHYYIHCFFYGPSRIVPFPPYKF